MRSDAQALAQESRERGTKTANKTKHTHEFNPGDRVYKIRDALEDSDYRKTASKFQGPYIILERGTNDVYKLANFYNGRILKNFVHVDKLKSCQSARAGRRRRPITIINTQHGTNGREHCDGPPTVGYNTCGSQDHRTHEHDPLGQTTRKCMSKPQETSQAGATAGTDNETNDLQNAFGNAGFTLAFDSELVCERGIPVSRIVFYL